MDYPYGKIRRLAGNLERFGIEGGEGVRPSDKGAKKAERLRAAMERMDSLLEPGIRRAGQVKHHLGTILGEELEVRVIETALATMGERGCRFELAERRSAGAAGDGRTS